MRQIRPTPPRPVLALRCLVAVVVAVALGVVAVPLAAHEGPPFPVVVDEEMGPYLVSVWTDPDIGLGTVFVVLEPPERGAELPPARVSVGVEPVSGRLDEVVYPAEPQAVRVGARHFTEVELDRGEMFRLRVTVDSPEGGGEASATVLATPDGTIGPIGLLLYPLPFVAVGFLWLKAVLARRERPSEAGEVVPEVSPDDER